MNSTSDSKSLPNLMIQIPLQTEQQPDRNASLGWQPFAIFVVKFQMDILDGQAQVHSKMHHFSDDLCAVWPSIEMQRIC